MELSLCNLTSGCKQCWRRLVYFWGKMKWRIHCASGRVFIAARFCESCWDLIEGGWGEWILRMRRTLPTSSRLLCWKENENAQICAVCLCQKLENIPEGNDPTCWRAKKIVFSFPYYLVEQVEREMKAISQFKINKIKASKLFIFWKPEFTFSRKILILYSKERNS